MENVCGICHGEVESGNENENIVVGMEESASRDVEEGLLLDIQIRQ